MVAAKVVFIIALGFLFPGGCFSLSGSGLDGQRHGLPQLNHRHRVIAAPVVKAYQKFILRFENTRIALQTMSELS